MQKRKSKNSVQDLMGIREFSTYGLQTDQAIREYCATNLVFGKRFVVDF